MKTLDQIALSTTTDRSSAYHDYARIYDELFGPIRAEPIVLLEQGVLSGDGIRMWNEYFPNGQIFGIDIHNWEQRWKGWERVKVMEGSQSNPQFLKQVIEESGPLDICIDDAGHFSNEQIVAFEFLWQYVKPGGYYICEDLSTSWSPQHCDRGRIIDYWLRIVEELHDHGAGAHGKVMDTDKWKSIDSIQFRKNLVILKKAAPAKPEKF